jgi:hypothetical protein
VGVVGVEGVQAGGRQAVIPVRQRIVNGVGGAGPPGDCFKCCVASILELPYEAVPHFVAAEWLVDPGTGVEPRKTSWHVAINDWLMREGWELRYHDRTYYKNPAPKSVNGEDVPYWDYLEKHEYPPRRYDTFWIASVLSANFRNGTHAIVMHGNEVVFDPSPRQRRVPYVFVGEGVFVPTDAALLKPPAPPPVRTSWTPGPRTSPC